MQRQQEAELKWRGISAGGGTSRMSSFVCMPQDGTQVKQALDAICFPSIKRWTHRVKWTQMPSMAQLLTHSKHSQDAGNTATIKSTNQVSTLLRLTFYWKEIDRNEAGTARRSSGRGRCRTDSWGQSAGSYRPQEGFRSEWDSSRRVTGSNVLKVLLWLLCWQEAD